MTKYSRALTALGAGLLAGVTFGAGAAQAAPPDTIEHCLMTSAADPPGPDCGAEMPLHIMIITLSDDDWPISAVLDHLHLPLMNGPAPGGDVGQPGMPGTPGMPGEEPTTEPTTEPTAEPTTEPTAEPTTEPTAEPTAAPTEEPTAAPTAEPTAPTTPTPSATAATAAPTGAPTTEPTSAAPQPTATETSGGIGVATTAPAP